MGIGRTLLQAWQIVRERRYLIILGLMAAVLTITTLGIRFSFGIRIEGNLLPLDARQAESEPPATEDPSSARVLAVGFQIFIVIAGTVAAAGAIYISRVLRGAMAVAVYQVLTIGTSSFEQGWIRAWRRGPALFATGLIGNAPVLAIVIYIGVLLAQAGYIVGTPLSSVPFNAGDLRALLPVLVIGTTFAVIMGAWRTYADRLTIIEDIPPVDAYLTAGQQIAVSAFFVFFLQFMIRLALNLLLLVMGVLAIATCVLLWFANLALNGLMEAVFSTYWTMIWHRTSSTS